MWPRSGDDLVVGSPRPPGGTSTAAPRFPLRSSVRPSRAGAHRGALLRDLVGALDHGRAGGRAGRRVPSNIQDLQQEVKSGHAFSCIEDAHRRDVGRVFVAGVDVADHTHAGVVGQYPREFLRGEFGAVGDGDLAGVDRPADARPAAVVNRHPGGA